MADPKQYGLVAKLDGIVFLAELDDSGELIKNPGDISDYEQIYGDMKENELSMVEITRPLPEAEFAIYLRDLGTLTFQESIDDIVKKGDFPDLCRDIYQRLIVENEEGIL